MLLCSCRLRGRRVEIVVCAAKGWLGLALGTCRVWVTQSPSPQPLLQLCDRSPSAPLWPRGVAALGTHSAVGQAGVPVGQPDLGHTPSCHGLSRGEGRPHTWETCSESGSGSDLRAAGDRPTLPAHSLVRPVLGQAPSPCAGAAGGRGALEQAKGSSRLVFLVQGRLWLARLRQVPIPLEGPGRGHLEGGRASPKGGRVLAQEGPLVAYCTACQVCERRQEERGRHGEGLCRAVFRPGPRFSYVGPCSWSWTQDAGPVLGPEP